MIKINLIDDAIPAAYFAHGPYKAENFNNGISGVMNKSGINCLTFESYPGRTLTDYDTAYAIAELWNSRVK